MSFDEQPDGDIHGECAAEIRRLEGEVTIWRNSAEAQTERLKEAEGAIADGKKPDLVPGVVHCARCNFRLNRVTLYMGNGAIGPGGSETEQCPNGCGPMWPVTWKQEAEDAYKTAESQFERAKAAEDQIDACRPYLKEGETAADALARLSAADEWRPIATAPAHGVRVLATWNNTWSKGGEHIEVCEAGERGEWFYSFDCDSPATEPTHWMPLPAAPTTTED